MLEHEYSEWLAKDVEKDLAKQVAENQDLVTAFARLDQDPTSGIQNIGEVHDFLGSTSAEVAGKCVIYKLDLNNKIMIQAVCNDIERDRILNLASAFAASVDSGEATEK